MASAYMTKVKYSSEEEQEQYKWEYSESVASATGTSIKIPAGVSFIGYTVKWTSGTYVVQACTDKEYTIDNDAASVTWVTSPSGSLAANFQDEVKAGASAIRIVTTGGTAEIKVSAK